MNAAAAPAGPGIPRPGPAAQGAGACGFSAFGRATP